MRTLQALLRQLSGARYESIRRSLMSSAILYLALASSGWRLDVAPFVLYLTSFAFTAGILWQLLCGRRQKELLEGFLALPLGNRELASAWEAALGAYVLLTRTVYVWALLLAAASWTGFELFWALVCGLAACIAAPGAFRLWKRRRLSWPADAYDFYWEGGRKNTKKRGAGRSRVRRYQSASVFRYLFRYLMDNQSYCVNTLGLGVMAVFLPLLAGQLLGPSFLPICFAILCLNTPLGTLLSGDPELLQAVRVLPGQERALGKGYCMFLFVVNSFLCAVCLCSWQLSQGGVEPSDVWMAALASLQSAVCSVVLEWKWPIQGWGTESELWRHPRKYLVPALLLLLTAAAGAWPGFLWLWSGALAAECGALVFSFRPLDK